MVKLVVVGGDFYFKFYLVENYFKVLVKLLGKVYYGLFLYKVLGFYFSNL